MVFRCSFCRYKCFGWLVFYILELVFLYHTNTVVSIASYVSSFHTVMASFDINIVFEEERRDDASTAP
ncbi:hypothetical protein L6452_37032 [Arctium lappa]|uniref:Uncharacterized protein n=1 Tax=Arctium lappa TaxID=4217 RepID=A0ACB8Y156_ARCLA|nr:hypothetical protein L6452_37032 [Arctium lappa]